MAFTFSTGTATVSTTAAAVLTAYPGVTYLIQNTGANPVFVGPSTVTSSGSTVGYSIPATTGSITIYAAPGEGTASLFAVTGTGTSTLVWLAN